MHNISCTLIAVTLAAGAVITSSPAEARQRKTAEQTTSTGLPVDSSGTPIIMKGYPAGQGKVVPRVSTPVVVPPPSTGLRDLPSRQLLQSPPPPVYAAPSQPSFNDKVTRCIQSYSLNAGVGNNPTDRTAYMGQCANQ
jgi:hypothetical protein